MSANLNQKMLKFKPNPNLVSERENSNLDVKKLQSFFGKILFASADRHKYMIALSKRLIKCHVYIQKSIIASLIEYNTADYWFND